MTTPEPVAIWMCGAFQPTPPRGMRSYRCTEPYGHTSAHRAVLDGEVLAEWPRPDEGTAR